MSRRKISEDDDKRRLVKEWDESGLSAEDFSKPRKIYPETLRAWGRAIRGPLPRGRRSRTRPVPRALELVEVGREERPHAREPNVEIITRSGCRLMMFTEWAPEQLAELVVLLEVDE